MKNSVRISWKEIAREPHVFCFSARAPLLFRGQVHTHTQGEAEAEEAEAEEEEEEEESTTSYIKHSIFQFGLWFEAGAAAGSATCWAGREAFTASSSDPID